MDSSGGRDDGDEATPLSSGFVSTKGEDEGIFFEGKDIQNLIGQPPASITSTLTDVFRHAGSSGSKRYLYRAFRNREMYRRDPQYVEKTSYSIDPRIGRWVYECWLGERDTRQDQLVELYSGTGNLTRGMLNEFRLVRKIEYSRKNVSIDRDGDEKAEVENVEQFRMNLEAAIEVDQMHRDAKGDWVILNPPWDCWREAIRIASHFCRPGGEIALVLSQKLVNRICGCPMYRGETAYKEEFLAILGDCGLSWSGALQSTMSLGRVRSYNLTA